MKAWSLQTRLLVAFATLGAAVSGGFALFVYLRLARVLASGIDSELRHRAEAIAQLCEWEDGAAKCEVPDSAAGAGSGLGEFVVVELPDHVIGGDDRLAAHARRVPANGSREFLGTIDEGDERERRTFAMRRLFERRTATETEPEQPAFEVAVLVATGTSPMRSALTATAWMLLAGCGLATALGAMVGVWLRRSLARPVVALARAAASTAGSVPSMPRTGSGDEVDQLAAALDGAFARIDAARVHERGFAADASHELRTPVAVVRTAAEVALLDAGLAEPQRTALVDILQASTRMGAIVDSLLLLTRIDGPDLAATFVACDLGAVVARSKAALAHEAEARSVRIEVAATSSVVVRGEAGLLEILVTNLLRNAIEWSPANAVVRVEVATAPLRLVVEDRGPGIAPELLPRVFDRFVRGDPARSRSRGGAGLGLSLVRAIADRHGAHCAIASEVGRGTTVTVVFDGKVVR